VSHHPLFILGLSFVTPALAVAGVAAIAVPIIIHLLTRRHRTPIPWGAMKFLLEAYKKHKRRLTLEQLLLLACRCLLVAVVGIALARPHMQDIRAQGPVHLYLLLDNSLTSAITETTASSSDSSAQMRTALDRYKSHARDLLSKLDASRGDRAALLTLSAPSDSPVLQPSTDLTAIARVVDAVTHEAARADLAGALARLRAEFSASDEASTPSGPRPRILIAILSDQRVGSLDLATTLPVLGAGSAAPLITALTPPTESISNIALVSVEPLRPIITQEDRASGPSSNQVRVTLHRFGPITSSAGSTPVKVWLTDDPSKTPESTVETTIRWTPGQESATAILDVPSPAARGVDALILSARIDPDRLPTDDIAVRSITARRAVRIAVVESIKLPDASSASIDRFSPGDWLRLLLQPDTALGPLQGPSLSGLAPTTIDPASVGRSGLAGFDAAVILAPDELTNEGWERLADFSRSGGVVFVAPPAAQSVHLWADSFTRTFNLDWTIARETVESNPPRALSPQAPGGSSNPLLGLLAGEMDVLTRPVSVTRSLNITAAPDAVTPIISFADGTPFVAAALPLQATDASKSHGLVVLLASAIDLSWSDLPTKPLMIPLLHEILRVGVGRTQPTFDQLAGSPARFPQGTAELAPADPRSQAVGPISTRDAWTARTAGLWRALAPQGTTISYIAINPDTAASDTTAITLDQSRELLSTIAGADRLVPIETGTQDADSAAAALAATSDDHDTLGLWLLAAALTLAIIELALARRFSHAQRSTNATTNGAASAVSSGGASTTSTGGVAA
jgi:hypothetical protein